MALVVSPPNDRKRVKVYELRNNDWFDRGTGFCTGRIVNVSVLSCVVGVDYFKIGQFNVWGWSLRMTDFTALQDESKVYVESEDQPDRLLLETKITKDDGYQKQQGMDLPQGDSWHGRALMTEQTL